MRQNQPLRPFSPCLTLARKTAESTFIPSTTEDEKINSYVLISLYTVIVARKKADLYNYLDALKEDVKQMNIIFT